MRKPGVSRGTRNMVVPCLGGTAGSVRASMKNSLPTGALAMKRFLAVEDPLVALALGAKLQPGLRVVAGGMRLSEPALGSVIPLPSSKVSSATKAWQEALLLLLGAAALKSGDSISSSG